MKTETERSWTDLEPLEGKHSPRGCAGFSDGTETERAGRIFEKRNVPPGSAQPRSREFFPPETPSPVSAIALCADRTARTTQTDCLAHDARNWLTALRIYCDLLRGSDAVAGGDEKKWMEELSSAVERGQDLVNSLLDSVEGTPAANGTGPDSIAVRVPVPPAALRFRKTDSVSPIPILSARTRRSFTNIGDAIARRLPLFERLAGSDIQIETKIRADAGDAALPESAFERILQNLVSNAIEAMPDGGRLRIALRAPNRKLDEDREYRTPKTLLLRITDSGRGIAPERLPYIFEVGVSGKSQRKSERPRHGFGLANVRELVERAGGTVRVRSHVGWGSCFEVELPMV